MRLFSITAIVETEDEKDLEAVEEAIRRAICPYPGDADHRCPRGWMTMTHELAEDEAATWREPDALNR
jgi:hypothetical protein